MKILSESVWGGAPVKDADQTRNEHTQQQALAYLREYNSEYCKTKTDAELLAALLAGGIYTNCRRFWAEQ